MNLLITDYWLSYEHNFMDFIDFCVPKPRIFIKIFVFHLNSRGSFSMTTEPITKNFSVFNIYIARAFDRAISRAYRKNINSVTRWMKCSPK